MLCNVVTQQDAFKTMLIICSSSCVIIIGFFQHWMLIGQSYPSCHEVHIIVCCFALYTSRRLFACWSVILPMLTHGIRTGRLRCMSLPPTRPCAVLRSSSRSWAASTFQIAGDAPPCTTLPLMGTQRYCKLKSKIFYLAHSNTTELHTWHAGYIYIYIYIYIYTYLHIFTFLGN